MIAQGDIYMKTICVLALSLLLSTMTSSCLPYPQLPEGIWRSEDPEMMLFITDDYAIRPTGIHPGLITIDSEEVKIIFILGNASTFTIEWSTAMGQTGGLRGSNPPPFIGRFEVYGDLMHYTLNPPFRERTGITRITFHRVEEYEPINIRDWGAHLDDIEVWFPSPEYEEEE
jgi:hypothetical protein